MSTGAGPVEMPSVIGQTFEEAQAALAGLGFTDIVREDAFNDDIAPNEVFEQSPTAGTEVTLDTPVTLTVSQGVEPVEVADVRGRTESEAANILGQQGFDVQFVDQASNDVGEGLVIDTNPPAGTPLAPGETVTVIVSSGPADVVVPDVEGQTEDDAREALEDAGFEVQVQTQPLAPGDDRDGTVIEQSPAGGSEAPPGSTVTITVGEAIADGG